MIIKRKVTAYPADSAEYVVMHARRQASRGRNPALPFLHIQNPRKALTLAERFAYFELTDGIYSTGATPANYVCAKCGATSCKLWREYQTMDPQLLCANCAATNQKKNISNINEDGRWSDDKLAGMTSDSIGWYVPAVPTEDGLAYWGYSSVPRAGCVWWAKLPTLPDIAAHN